MTVLKACLIKVSWTVLGTIEKLENLVRSQNFRIWAFLKIHLFENCYFLCIGHYGISKNMWKWMFWNTGPRYLKYTEDPKIWGSCGWLVLATIHCFWNIFHSSYQNLVEAVWGNYFQPNMIEGDPKTLRSFLIYLTNIYVN